MNKKELKAKLVAEMREISDKAKAEVRSLTADEQKAYDEKAAEVRKLTVEIEQEAREAELNGFTDAAPGIMTGANAENESRAASFVQTGKTEMRAILSTGTIAKPTSVATDVNGSPEVGESIVDDVNAVPLTGNGAWVVPYEVSGAVAADVTDGADVGGTEPTYNYVTINPAEWGVFTEISKQVKKMSPVAYEAAVKKSALIGLRAKAATKIIAAVTSSALSEKLFSKTLNATYLRTLVLGFDGIEGKGEAVLYIAKADLQTLGDVRGTNEKKAVYEITFDTGTTKAGIIKDGGTAVKFRVLNGLTAGTQLFGQPKTIDMPMWDEYEIATDESGEFFKKNTMGVRGFQTANAGLVALHGMQVVKQAAE